MFEIHPYVSEWDGQRVWVFDDPAKGLINEGLVSGTDQILDAIAARFPDGEKGFTLTFSDTPFAGQELIFEWIKTGTGEGLAEGVEGNWYREPMTGFEGWLCPALFKYFDTAPKHIYVRSQPIVGKLERGTGKIVIQGTDQQKQRDAAKAAGLSSWIERGVVKTSKPVDPNLFGDHNYGGRGSTFRLGPCLYGCGCEMNQSSSSGPVDPFGPCPNHLRQFAPCGAVAIVCGDEVLLLRRSPTAGRFPNFWNFPGGVCNPGETPPEAAIRECVEGAGIHLRRIIPLVIVQIAESEVHFYMAPVGSKPAVTLNSEHSEYRWVRSHPSYISMFDIVPGIAEACSKLRE